MADATHPAWYARAATWLVNAAKAVKNTVVKIAGMSDKLSTEIQAVAPTVEALSNIVLPGSGNFEAHILDVWSVAASAVDAADEAALANGIDVKFDAALVAAIKAVLPTVKQFLHPAAGPQSPTS